MDNPSEQERAQLTVNGDEANAVLTIIARRGSGQAIGETDWVRLFCCEPYQWMKTRESELGVALTEGDFVRFVLSPELAGDALELRRTLDQWRGADFRACSVQALDYLPPQACIRAKIFPVIKPQRNSFAHCCDAGSAVFLALDPRLTPQQLRNMITHELHHVGVYELWDIRARRYRNLAANLRTALAWMDAFSEGMAMLAAAGGAHIHPQAAGTPEDRERWDRDMADFNANLKRVDRFLLDIIESRLPPAETEAAGRSLFGVQGPWYTVGWKMASIVESCYGREGLLECMLDWRLLLARYNAAMCKSTVGSEGKRLTLWSPLLLQYLMNGEP